MINFNELPICVQEECKDTLKAFNEVNVTFEDGKYDVSTGIVLKVNYAKDHKFIGTYKAKDIFTKEEQIINYIENFHSFPIEYKGIKDWQLLKELKKIGEHAKVKFNTQGNIELKID